ncbi:aminoglycoside phosphotransferase family protein [Lederbergia wuyishanensis]|uniref:Streptomycin 6-kinase n=1 Tax=Lederbergia wuyishanensis TaxID=1347903 RepID=A0ABU0DA35_9BACI|nr:aminoglycoside phosphotransferase family protein [Lederbergia wuyishanensis]MCJ8008447.1 aminoglycoside phosphotransferase family protein [Lederbergia wuyishanensis]MDQ0345190.1 streptomycin 6-kinase [Lederbergia wuyishanensis]
MIYSFKQNEIEKIIKHFGKDFYEKVLRDITVYPEQWSLTSLQFIPSYSANIVFTCISEKFGNAVLKIGKSNSREISTEFNTLNEYKGRRFCRVFNAEIENGVILEEWIKPGNPLRDEDSLDKRLSVFSSLFKDLHKTPGNTEIYPTYIEWVDKIAEYMSKRQDCKELYLYMKKAQDICHSLSSIHSQKMLLHGDFHHDNILLNTDGEYKIIDPKGVVGDPIFDVPRFILNEFGDEITPELYEKINYIINVLEKSLDIPNEVIKKCLFVETAMGICWCVEDGAVPEEYSELVKTVAFAEDILNN